MGGNCLPIIRLQSSLSSIRRILPDKPISRKLWKCPRQILTIPIWRISLVQIHFFSTTVDLLILTGTICVLSPHYSHCTLLRKVVAPHMLSKHLDLNTSLNRTIVNLPYRNWFFKERIANNDDLSFKANREA